MSTTRRLSLKEGAELAIGATGAVVATDQVIKSIDSDEDQFEHLLKAGVGAAVAIGAYEMLRRASVDPGSPAGSRRHSGSSSGSKSGSNSSNHPHHTRHLTEEIIGAYALGKELLGDKHNHIAHMVGEAIGATGLVQELREKNKELEEKEPK